MEPEGDHRVANENEAEVTALALIAGEEVSRPRDAEGLAALAEALGGLKPLRGGPREYLWHALDDEGRVAARGGGARDSVVWACRGGGKTALGAMATMLDMVMNPGIQVRIVAGSLHQAGHMHAHLCGMFGTERLGPLVKGRITGTRLELVNGSRVELLAQSQRAVRGTRVHRLRCDEVELFDPALWDAAQMVTRSEKLGNHRVCGSIEAFSTMHVAHGLMHDIVESAEARGRRVFKWGLGTVLGACACRSGEVGEEERNACPIADLCAGRGEGEEPGFYDAGDALAVMRRVPRSVWDEEMLCVRPSRRDSVFPEFEAGQHVVKEEPAWVASATWMCGLDFGIRKSALVWAAHDPVSGMLYVADERVMENKLLSDQVEAIMTGGWPRPAWVGVDPAGGQRNKVSGRTDIDVLRDAGLQVKDKRLDMESGISAVRARLRDATGRVGLRVHERCEHLVRALGTFHYDTKRRDKRDPVKDGNDHIADALRYLVINMDRAYSVKTGRWA